MTEKKEKSSGKKLLFMLIGVVVLIGGMFGGMEVYKQYQASQYKNDDSYKVTTQRDESYDGFYTLTKLDEDGNNTWDGLALYVEKDKIVSCSQYDYYSIDDLKRLMVENGDAESIETAVLNEGTIMSGQVDVLSYVDDGIISYLATGMDKGAALKSRGNSMFVLVNTGEFVCTDKVDFEKFTGTKSDYQFMKDCNLVPGYDEESQEVWLSKLLSNEQSIYHEGYVLNYYKDSDEFGINCEFASYSDWFQNFNEMFNANYEL